MAFDMYREIIIDHYKNPRNFGTVERPDVEASSDNPLCGDQVRLTVRLDPRKQTIKEIKFSGTGCSLTRAGASMLTDFVTGKTLAELRSYSAEQFIKDMGVPVMPARKKCAILAWRTLQGLLAEAAAHPKQ